MDKISREELLRSRLAGQFLTQPATPEQVAGGLCGLQAQYAFNALHGLRIRCKRTDTTALVKSWTLRGTLHLFPQKDLPLHFPDGQCDFFDTPYGKWRYGHGCPLPRERMAFFADVVEAALSNIPVTRDELKTCCREQGMTAEEEPWVFDGWGGVIRMLAEAGALCLSAEENRAYIRCPAFTPMAQKDARRELLRRHLTCCGPVTLRDMAYFFRWPQQELKGLLAELPAEQIRCEGAPYYYIGVPNALPPVPECVFLAGFDPMLLSYEKQDNPILPAEWRKQLFNNTGIVFPALLVNGRVCGKWKEQPRAVEVTLFEPCDPPLLQETARPLWPEKQLVLRSS